MIELNIRVEDVDYESLAELLLPALTAQLEQNSLGRLFFSSPEGAKSAAMKLLGRMTQEQKDEFLAKYLNQNSAKGAQALEEMAVKNGVRLRIRSLSAKTL